jgi:hypothetical protein
VGGGSALDGPLALNRAIVQVEGSAQRIPAELLKQFADGSQSPPACAVSARTSD